jgi:2-polyprenyl-3-methyl-5-hydroxy-6-metoxy-1,4-benzoquinol methylase
MYDSKIIRDLFEKWGNESIEGDPEHLTMRWAVPWINHMVLDMHLPHEGFALDAGCGQGYEAIFMAKRGLRVTALDISNSLLHHTGQRAKAAGVSDSISLMQADIVEPFMHVQQDFDVCISLTGVISHTGDKHKEAIANLVGLVKNGGFIILGVQSYYGKIRQYLSMGMIDEAEWLASTRLTHTVSDSFYDYCFTA